MLGRVFEKLMGPINQFSDYKDMVMCISVSLGLGAMIWIKTRPEYHYLSAREKKRSLNDIYKYTVATAGLGGILFWFWMT